MSIRVMTAGEQRGRPYQKFATERVDQRLNRLPEHLTPEEATVQAALIEVEEAAKPTGAPVAGFDHL